LDPVFPYLAEGVGQASLKLRRYDDAIQLKNTRKLDPNFGLGDRDHAFAWFEKVVDQHEISFGPKTDAMFDPLRSDPRVAALLRRMNLN
jgi:hypothetical protein